MIEAAKRVLPLGLHRHVLQQVTRLNRATGGQVDAHPHQSTIEVLDEHYRPEVDRLVAAGLAATAGGAALVLWSADPRPTPTSQPARQVPTGEEPTA